MPPRSVYKLKRTAVQTQRERLRQPYNPRNQQGKLLEPKKTKLQKTFEKLDKPVALRVPAKYRQPTTKKPPIYKGFERIER